jgi:hypothetical protein
MSLTNDYNGAEEKRPTLEYNLLANEKHYLMPKEQHHHPAFWNLGFLRLLL